MLPRSTPPRGHAPTDITAASVPPGAPSPRLVFVAAYVALAAIAVVQIALSNAAMGFPLHLRGLLGVRGIETAIGLAGYLGTIALVRRLAEVDRLGVMVAFIVTLLAMLPAAALASVVPMAMQRLGLAVVFKGSVVAKAVSELVTAGLALALAIAHEAHQRARAREAQALQLEARLAEARLQALSSQLRPHYLFNTLNAISVVVHRDSRAADAMLVGLADLLRATLQQREAHEIPLVEELTLLERYLAIMRHRFGPRLSAEVSVAPDAAGLLVPPFVLQPLVENALEHGIGRRAGHGTLRVTVRRLGDRLLLEVVDDGAGLGPRRADGDGNGEGLGLSITRHRLEQLYGSAQRLTLEPGDGGRGARATVEIPARAAPAVVAATPAVTAASIPA